MGLGPPFPSFSHRASKLVLQASVVGLGFGMNLSEVVAAGRTGLGFTVATIGGTLALGWLLGRVLRVDGTTSCLLSTGTAICGGSAIAAVGAVLEADPKAMSVALGTVFVLNAVGLFLFPPVGHALGLGQEQFGVWAAIAIHDTSSVVGAAARYGDAALRVATTVKLTRALWIAPLALAVAAVTRRPGARLAIPWFVLWFVVAAAARSLVPDPGGVFPLLAQAARRGLTLALLFIGASISRQALQQVGGRVVLQGIVLWIVVSAAGLVAVRALVG